MNLRPYPPPASGGLGLGEPPLAPCTGYMGCCSRTGASASRVGGLHCVPCPDPPREAVLFGERFTGKSVGARDVGM